MNTDPPPGEPSPDLPPGHHTNEATPARIYDYLLHGKDNYPIDRAAGDRIEAREPNSRLIVRTNREFLVRVVRYLVAEAGLDQIIDLGSGLPTQENVHQVAQAIEPGCRVVYVDNDPLVLAHGQAILADNPNTRVITADLRDAPTVLDKASPLIDFTRPWALLAVAVFHFIAEDPRAIIGAYRAHMPIGSHLALSHLSQDATTREVAQEITDIYRTATAPMVLRRRAEIEAIFEGFTLVEPGLPLIMDWRPPVRPVDPQRVWLFGAVGRRTPD